VRQEWALYVDFAQLVRLPKLGGKADVPLTPSIGKNCASANNEQRHFAAMDSTHIPATNKIASNYREYFDGE
jgi:hypothetical protein